MDFNGTTFFILMFPVVPKKLFHHFLSENCKMSVWSYVAGETTIQVSCSLSLVVAINKCIPLVFSSLWFLSSYMTTLLWYCCPLLFWLPLLLWKFCPLKLWLWKFWPLKLLFLPLKFDEVTSLKVLVLPLFLSHTINSTQIWHLVTRQICWSFAWHLHMLNSCW